MSSTHEINGTKRLQQYWTPLMGKLQNTQSWAIYKTNEVHLTLAPASFLVRQKPVMSYRCVYQSAMTVISFDGNVVLSRFRDSRSSILISYYGSVIITVRRAHVCSSLMIYNTIRYDTKSYFNVRSKAKT